MIIPVGFAQVNMLWTGNGYTRGAQTVFGVQNAGALSPSAIATLVIAVWAGTLDAHQANTITLDRVRVKLGPNATGLDGEGSSGATGGLLTNPLPPNVAGLVTKHTALGGRKGKGKMFLPGFTEDQTDGAGRFTPAALAAIQTELDDFLTDLDTAGIPMFLLHSDATAPNEVTELELQQLMATQRRRLRKVGGRRPVAP